MGHLGSLVLAQLQVRIDTFTSALLELLTTSSEIVGGRSCSRRRLVVSLIRSRRGIVDVWLGSVSSSIHVGLCRVCCISCSLVDIIGNGLRVGTRDGSVSGANVLCSSGKSSGSSVLDG